MQLCWLQGCPYRCLRLISAVPAGRAAVRCWSSLATTSSITQQDLEQQDLEQHDFHDPYTARQLTARLAKTKKRILKRHQDFVDFIQVEVSAGKGGDGGVAFHSEKFVARGGPSGGNGGQGGNVYIRPTARLTSLSALKKRMKAGNGSPGQGSWKHGKRGDDLVIEVPYGTVIREIRSNFANSIGEADSLDLPWSVWRRQTRALAHTDPDSARARRKQHFVLFPGTTDDENMLESRQIKELELSVLEDERRRLLAMRDKPPLGLDFDELQWSKSKSSGVQPKAEPILVAQGAQGGFGNPYFATADIRNPRFASRGSQPDSLHLQFELKTLADVGLVGLPNAGKSTLLRSLTFSKSTIAPYAFTTLSPQIGTLLVFNDGSYTTVDAHHTIQDSSELSQSFFTRQTRHISDQTKEELLRLSIADCPGLLPGASDNVGLGHNFLRHIERSRLLVYVVDLSARNPSQDLAVLRTELEAYKPGLSGRALIVVANKADKASSTNGGEEAMRSKLENLRILAAEWSAVDGRTRRVLPMSAKLRGNVDSLVASFVDVFIGTANKV